MKPCDKVGVIDPNDSPETKAAKRDSAAKAISRLHDLQATHPTKLAWDNLAVVLLRGTLLRLMSEWSPSAEEVDAVLETTRHYGQSDEELAKLILVAYRQLETRGAAMDVLRALERAFDDRYPRPEFLR